MLVPSIFGERFFDDFDRMFDFPEPSERNQHPAAAPHRMGLMKTEMILCA